MYDAYATEARKMRVCASTSTPIWPPPSTAARRFFVDCLVHDPGAVDRAVEVFGEDKVVLGSDWPFPMGTKDPASLIAHRGTEFVERAATENARTALGAR